VPHQRALVITAAHLCLPGACRFLGWVGASRYSSAQRPAGRHLGSSLRTWPAMIRMSLPWMNSP